MKTSNKLLLGALAFVAILGVIPIFILKSNIGAIERTIVRGNGDFQKETRSHRDFEEININGEYDVVLTQGDKFEVTLEAEANLLEHLETTVKNGTLRLGTKDGSNVISESSPTAYVTMPELRRLGIYGSGLVTNETPFQGDLVELVISGDGELDMNFECTTMKTVISGSGEIKLRGKGEFLESRNSGSGKIKAENFITETANITISGSGDARVHVKEHLQVSVSGSGTVLYDGSPKDINKYISGSGEVRPI